MNDNSTIALGFGLASRDRCGKILEVCYRLPILSPEQTLLDETFSKEQQTGNAAHVILPNNTLQLGITDNQQLFVATFCRLASPIVDVADAYLKLHLLSYRQLLPNSVNLSKIFKVLPTVAWTNEGAIAIAELEQRQWQARVEKKHLKVYAVDKFPSLLDYLVPSGVRIADSARVRLGAYLGEGTTVMPSGFINFNAGCHGPNMIEGRVSQGVMIDRGSDLGGGASTMGTLSGGNDGLVSVGKNCLIGANAGIGLSLGDNCTVEAGLYVTAGAKVHLIIDGCQPKIVKARELSARSNLLWRRNSHNGQLECLTNDRNFQLNHDLHVNN